MTTTAGPPRIAGASGEPPEGLVIEEEWDLPSLIPGDRAVTARVNGRLVGGLMWNPETGIIQYVQMDPDMRRRGIATMVLAEARRLDPRVRHDVEENRSETGRAWVQHVGREAPNASEQLLDMELQMRGPNQTGNFYGSIAAILKRHGKRWDRVSSTLPPGMKIGPMGQCYSNALFAAINSRGALIYCEGLAQHSDGFFPMPHGWCVDGEGTVFDPTWNKANSYWGIPFDTRWLAQHVITKGTDSVFGDDIPGPALRQIITGGLPSAAINATGKSDRSGIEVEQFKRRSGPQNSYEGVVAADKGPQLGYRGFGSWEEARYAITHGRWTSRGMFTVPGEGQTQMALSLGEVIANAGYFSLRGTGFLGAIEVDMAGLPFRTFISKPEVNADGKGRIKPDLGLGIGIDSGIPLDRIKKVFQIDEHGKVVKTWDYWDDFVHALESLTDNPEWSPELEHKQETQKIWVGWDVKGSKNKVHRLMDNQSQTYCGKQGGGFKAKARVSFQKIIDNTVTTDDAPLKEDYKEKPRRKLKPCEICFKDTRRPWQGRPVLPEQSRWSSRHEAGPAGDLIPERFRSPFPVSPRELHEGRPVVLDRPAEHDYDHLPDGVRNRLHEVLDEVEDGTAELEPKTRELAGTFSARLTSAWRALFYMGRERFWHMFAITDHDYAEAGRRWVAVKTAMPSWRDRGQRPEAEALIAPDLGRHRRNNYAVYLYGQPHARRGSLEEAKASVEEIYGPLEWAKAEGDQRHHIDEVWGWTTMFNDAPYYLVVDRLPRLGVTGAAKVHCTECGADYFVDGPEEIEAHHLKHVTADLDDFEVKQTMAWPDREDWGAPKMQYAYAAYDNEGEKVGWLSLGLYTEKQAWEGWPVKQGDTYFYVTGTSVIKERRRQGVAMALWNKVHKDHPGIVTIHGTNRHEEMTAEARALLPALKAKWPDLHYGSGPGGRIAATSLTWDQVKARYPLYGAYAMDSAVSELAAGGPDSDGHVVTPDLTFTVEEVDLHSIKFQRYPVSDSRMKTAQEGYEAGTGIPPVLLVSRAGELHTVDGHHRLSAEESLDHTRVLAVIAHSQKNDRYSGRASIGKIAAANWGWENVPDTTAGSEPMPIDEVLSYCFDWARDGTLWSAKEEDNGEYGVAYMHGLVESVRQQGMRKPAVLRRNADGSVQCIDGNHRAAAAKKAGETTMPVVWEEAWMKTGVYFMYDVNEPLVDTKPMHEESSASFQFIHPLIATGGAIRRTSDLRILYRRGVRGIVSGRRDFDDASLTMGKDMGIEFLDAPTKDDGQPKPTSWFKSALDFCLPIMRRGGKVYIHCHSGVNRGPSLAYCVLRAWTGMGHDEAVRAIESQRDIVRLIYTNDADKALFELGYIKERGNIPPVEFAKLPKFMRDKIESGEMEMSHLDINQRAAAKEEPEVRVIKGQDKVRLSNPRVQVKQGTPNTSAYRSVGFSGQAWRFWIEDPNAPDWMISKSKVAPDFGQPMMGNFEGSTDKTVAYLDVFESNQGDWIDVAFMTTRGRFGGAGDYTRQGLAGHLMQACYDKFAPKRIYWGKIMHDDAESLRDRFRREMPERTGSVDLQAQDVGDIATDKPGSLAVYVPPETTIGPLFHGTTASRAEEILRDGFRDTGTRHGLVVHCTHTAEQAMGYAKRIAEHAGEEPAVLQIEAVVGVSGHEVAYYDPDKAREAGAHYQDKGAEVLVLDPSRMRGISRIAAADEFENLDDWRPTKGMYSPGKKMLDPRIFDPTTEQMHPDVRKYVMDSLDAYWTPKYGDWQKWTKVYLAGSGASYWWESDTDLDILLGIDLEVLREARPANKLVTDSDVFGALNKGLIDDLRPGMAAHVFKGGEKPFAVTYFANPGSWDIKALHPYAAYDISADQWVTHPPVLPDDWGPHYIPDEVWRRCQQLAREAEEILSLPEPERTAAGVTFFDWVHEGRKAAYSAYGQGWLDPQQIAYQFLEQHPHALLRRLYLLKHPEAASPEEVAKGQAGVLLDDADDITYLPEFQTIDVVAALAEGYTLDVEEEPRTDRWGLPKLTVKAKHEGRTVGSLSVFQRLYEGDEKPVAHPNVWVDEEHQRKGLATAMYAEVKRRWPDVPIVHSEDASDAAKALNRTLAILQPSLVRSLLDAKPWLDSKVADVLAGKVPGMKMDPTISRGLAGHAYGAEIVVSPKWGDGDEFGRFMLLTHEAGHSVPVHKVQAHPKFEEVFGKHVGGGVYALRNPWGIQENLSEVVADGYSEICLRGERGVYEDPEYPPAKALKIIAEVAKAAGMPIDKIETGTLRNMYRTSVIQPGRWFHACSPRRAAEVQDRGYFPADYRPKFANWGIGVYLSNDHVPGRTFGNATVEVVPTWQNPFEFNLAGLPHPPLLGMIERDFTSEMKVDIADALAKWKKSTWAVDLPEKVTEVLARHGYDGMVIHRPSGEDWGVVFDPTMVHVLPGKPDSIAAMAYDECLLKGDRGRCASWPILDPARAVHPGLMLGGGGGGICVSHAKQLLRDVRAGHSDVFDREGHPTDLEGRRRDTGEIDPEWRQVIERVHDVYVRSSGDRYLGMRNRRVPVASEPSYQPGPPKTKISATEYVDRPEHPHALTVQESKGVVTVEGEPFGSVRRDPNRVTRKEWVLTHPDGSETEHATKGNALWHAGKTAPLPKKQAATLSAGVTPEHRMVMDSSTNNPHLMKIVDGEPKALCNARYNVWDAGTVGDENNARLWGWAACERCEKKAQQGERKIEA